LNRIFVHNSNIDALHIYDIIAFMHFILFYKEINLFFDFGFIFIQRRFF